MKIYRKSCRRSCRKGKSDYRYYRLYVPIPAEFKTVVEPFLHKELEVDVKVVENGQLLIIMAQEQTLAKILQHAEKPPLHARQRKLLKWMDQQLEYRLKTLELNTLKGIIGEQLARSFIRNILAPKLVDEEGWDNVVFSNNDYKLRVKRRKGTLFSFDSYREDFIVHGFYACRKLLARYADVVGILQHNHCTPDGLLLKLRETGKTKALKENVCPSITSFRVEESRKHGDRLEFPFVDGDLEVVEIKCGRGARLMSKQKETYNDLIAKDVPLRMIKVRIISFDTNEFLVEERRYERFLQQDYARAYVGRLGKPMDTG